MQDKIKQLLKDIQAGDIKSLARAISLVENEGKGYEELLLSLSHTQDAKVIGITGPPGAGKSTLVNSLLQYWANKNKKIAVIAVDPSSPFNYGALLGDRIRMSRFYNHPDVYIRSLASRGALGGLSAKILEITDIVKQGNFDFIIVETVGVGQSEVEIAGLADCTIVALVPEAGDEVQTLKAGIMEIADIFLVNKADRENADAFYRNLKILAHEKANKSIEEIPVIKTIATREEGIILLAEAIGNCLSQHINTRKKILLLTEKALHIIAQKRMKDIHIPTLQNEIEAALENEKFNLYHCIAKYS